MKYATLTDIAKLVMIDYAAAEEAVSTVMPTWWRDKLMYPLEESLEAIIGYASGHVDKDGFAFKSIFRYGNGSKICDKWRACRDRATAVLGKIDAMESESM